MDYQEALSLAIIKQKFLDRCKIDDTSHEEARDGGGEDSDTSNCSKIDSDSESDPDGWDIPLDERDKINDNMDSRSLTLKEKEKEILKLLYNVV